MSAIEAGTGRVLEAGGEGRDGASLQEKSGGAAPELVASTPALVQHVYKTAA